MTWLCGAWAWQVGIRGYTTSGSDLGPRHVFLGCRVGAEFTQAEFSHLSEWAAIEYGAQ